jgi:ABC-type dipeptide/oligopeptide/nickel transport system permease component
MRIPRFLIIRLALIIPVLVGVTAMTFIVARVMVPNAARAWAGLITNPSVIHQLVVEYHLNDPLYTQYGYYMYDIITGNWGLSPTTKLPVLYEIENYFPATAELVIVASLMSIVLGTLFGVYAAVKHDTAVDHGIRFTYLSGIATPPFLAALVASIIFTHIIPILPSGGELSPGLTAPRITGMILLDTLITGKFNLFLNALDHIILPASVLTFLGFGIGARVIRASMLEALSQDFIRTARSKGLGEPQVIWRHAFRNALSAATTVVALNVSALLGGTLVVEYIFSWPGMGFFAVNSILNYDFPSVIGITLVYAFGVVIANLVADVLYTYLDPRVRL